MRLPTDDEVEACSYYARLNSLIFHLDVAPDHVIEILLALIARDSDIEDDHYGNIYRHIITTLRTDTTKEPTDGRQS